jgi:hypothetical protein
MTVSLPARSLLKKKLWRIAFAKWSTSNVKIACDYLLKNASSIDNETYAVFTTGIIVRYARPFGSNDGVGCLPKNFGEFGDPKLQKLHNLILLSRDRFFAHSDALANYEQHNGQKNKILSSAIVANFGSDGMASSVHLQVIEPSLELSIIPEIKTLCTKLIEKLDVDEKLLIRQLFTDSQLREGVNPINIFDES